MIYPNPLQPNRYVTVVAGTSADGLYFWIPALWNTSGGFPTSYWDWTITDGRRVTLTSLALGAERGWVAAGMFDQHWRRDDGWVYVGDSTLRHSSPLRRAPWMGSLCRQNCWIHMLESTSSPPEFLSALPTRESTSRSNLHRDGRSSSMLKAKLTLLCTIRASLSFSWRMSRAGSLPRP